MASDWRTTNIEQKRNINITTFIQISWPHNEYQQKFAFSGFLAKLPEFHGRWPLTGWHEWTHVLVTRNTSLHHSMSIQQSIISSNRRKTHYYKFSKAELGKPYGLSMPTQPFLLIQILVLLEKGTIETQNIPNLPSLPSVQPYPTHTQLLSIVEQGAIGKNI